MILFAKIGIQKMTPIFVDCKYCNILTFEI